MNGNDRQRDEQVAQAIEHIRIALDNLEMILGIGGGGGTEGAEGGEGGEGGEPVVAQGLPAGASLVLSADPQHGLPDFTGKPKGVTLFGRAVNPRRPPRRPA
jgi:hypothetical protein